MAKPLSKNFGRQSCPSGSVNLAIHVEHPNRCGGYRRRPTLDVAVSAARRGVEYRSQAPVINDHDQIVGEVDLNDIAGCTPGVRYDAVGERDRGLGTSSPASGRSVPWPHQLLVGGLSLGCCDTPPP
jgi:hypothetical protein